MKWVVQFTLRVDDAKVLTLLEQHQLVARAGEYEILSWTAGQEAVSDGS